MLKDGDESHNDLLRGRAITRGRLNLKNKKNDILLYQRRRCACGKIPLFPCLIIIIGFFLFCLILSLFLCNYYMMQALYDAINNNEIQLSKCDNANEDEIISTSMRKGILKNA